MCLYANTPEPFIIEEDIVCYKFLRKVPYKGKRFSGFWSSPFRSHKWVMNQLETVELEPYPYDKEHHVAEYHDVEVGLHSLVSIADTYSSMNEYQRENYYNRKLAVFKCIIPKGSKVYRGVWYSERRKNCGYVSNQLIVKRKTNIFDNIINKYKMNKLSHGQKLYEFF